MNRLGNLLDFFLPFLFTHTLSPSTHAQTVRVKVYAEQAPWQRIKQGGVEHHHAFILEPSVVRFCTVSQLKGGECRNAVNGWENNK